MVWILVSLAVLGALAILLGVFAYRKEWRSQKGTDYYTFFVMGLSWMIIGIAANLFYSDFMTFFLVLGLVWFVLGILNFQNWRTDKRDARALSKWIRRLPRGSGYLIGVLIGVLVMWPILMDLPGMVGAGVAAGFGIGLAIEKGIHGKPPKAMEHDKRLMKLMVVLVALGLLAFITLFLVLGL